MSSCTTSLKLWLKMSEKKNDIIISISSWLGCKYQNTPKGSVLRFSIRKLRSYFISRWLVGLRFRNTPQYAKNRTLLYKEITQLLQTPSPVDHLCWLTVQVCTWVSSHDVCIVLNGKHEMLNQQESHVMTTNQLQVSMWIQYNLKKWKIIQLCIYHYMSLTP